MPGVPKRNFLDVVTRAQLDNERRNQENKEDPKTRRRRLYKVFSEEKPIFPVQKQNFYSTIMENKEVVKMFSILSACTQELRQVLILKYYKINLCLDYTGFIFLGFDGVFGKMETIQFPLEERTERSRTFTNIFDGIREYAEKTRRARRQIGD